MKAYKAFNHDWSCRDFKFEIGKTYVHDGDVRLCLSGFHACEAPLDVLNYYPPTANFAEVELDGVSEQKENDTKRVAKSITVKAALNIAGLVSAQVEWCKSRYGANIASGDYSTAASSGDYSTAASSGDYSKAEASGKKTVAMVAGIGGMARAGELGAFALPYMDGEQVRILVGVIGENGIKSDTWYCVDDGKLVEA